VEKVPRERTTYDARVTRHFLTGEELTADELTGLLDRADFLKRDRLASAQLAGRSVALVFEKPSTRTRVSFEVGVSELGGHPVVLREGEMQVSRGESPRDTGLVLSRFVHAIGVRAFADSGLEELARYATVPVFNMLTDGHHPCQVLADLQTLRERFGRLEGLKLAYVGDGNNVANSLMLIGARAGVEVAVATPAELAPNPAIVQRAGDRAHVTTDPAEAADGAHALYTDVWVSMGDEGDAERLRSLLGPYQLNEELLAKARPDAIVLHCLPAHPGEEITEGLLYGDRSAVFDQAENRLHAQKALLEFLLGASSRKVPASG
jgi:ornithine carbamoyltransferase